MNYFPKYFTTKAISLYLGVLILSNILFFSNALHIIWWLFGMVEAIGFFYFSNQFSRKWSEISEKKFVRKLFQTGVIIRLVWVIFSYFFYIKETGQPFEFSAGDAIFYHTAATKLAQQGLSNINSVLFGVDLADRGYPVYLSLVYTIFGNNVIFARFIKAILGSFTAVLVYHLSKRTFNEETGRMAAVFTMLMPNLIMYCGLQLKEVEMVFLTVAFIERTDYIIRSRKFNFINITLPILIVGVLFFFRTVLGVALLFSFLTTLMLSSSRILGMGKRTILIIWSLLLIGYFVGGKIATNVEELWEARNTNQQESMQWRSERQNGNLFAKYATSSVFIPLIVVIPFPTIVNVPGQENQQLINGGNYVKNMMAFFVILATIATLREKKWRDYLLIGSFTIGYLLIIAMSAFAQSERFHQPALPFLMIMAAYGVNKLDNGSKKYFKWWMVMIFIAVVGWSWFKLAGRGLA